MAMLPERNRGLHRIGPVDQKHFARAGAGGLRGQVCFDFGLFPTRQLFFQLGDQLFRADVAGDAEDRVLRRIALAVPLDQRRLG